MLPHSYPPLLDKIKVQYTKLLADNLVGIYVHGSIALDCFNPKKSDIDYIVVVNEPLTHGKKQELIAATVLLNYKAPKKGIEMSVVQKKHCQQFVYPTPFDLHFSKMHLKLWQDYPALYLEQMTGVDADLAAHFTIINHCGIVLCGEEIGRVFSTIDSAFYFDSIKSDVRDSKNNILADPVYTVLNLCRVLAYKESGGILSKCNGGEWGMANLPHEYHSLIKSAIRNYLSDSNGNIVPNKDVAMQFCDFMLEQIF